MVDRAEESALIERLRARRTELLALLQRSSDHWGFEDPVYRFYHQSFKVFALQAQTDSIVRELQALAPDRSLNEWFAKIIGEGTGRVFSLDDNKVWLTATRPVLEAFFHARYFLEMASELEVPPNPLPSGYAALLYLYRLR